MPYVQLNATCSPRPLQFFADPFFRLPRFFSFLFSSPFFLLPFFDSFPFFPSAKNQRCSSPVVSAGLTLQIQVGTGSRTQETVSRIPSYRVQQGHIWPLLDLSLHHPPFIWSKKKNSSAQRTPLPPCQKKNENAKMSWVSSRNSMQTNKKRRKRVITQTPTTRASPRGNATL